eukprot:m.172158 g.172158  ORF g.172158 m.172158 type:complete len:360 (+) comp18282_c0_seq59:176-1255(+)
MMSLRWGICGTGKIAHDFTAALNSLQFDVAFVGASSKEKAAEFAKLHNVLAHGTYVDLAESDSVDVVYIGTVHSAHKKHCLMMLNKNKAVLCEKPCTLNANDTKEVIAAARSNGVFFAEAMWTRYTPIVIEARKRLQRGDIGKIVMVQSDFGFRADTSNGGRLFDRALGGGGLLDIGIYPLAAASMAFGCTTPVATQAVGSLLGDTGCDVQASVALDYGANRCAAVTYTLLGQTREETTYVGTTGTITLHSPAHCPNTMTITRYATRNEAEKESITIDFPKNESGLPLNFPGSEGLQYQAQAVAEAIAAGNTDSAFFSNDESIAIASTMDAIRRQLGVVYPGDIEMPPIRGDGSSALPV